MYIRHLKKFLSAVEKLPAGKEATPESEKLLAGNEKPSDSVALSEAHLMTSQRLEPSRKSSRHEQPPRLSTERVDKHWRSTGVREKARSSTDKERSRRSVDTFDRTRDENEQTDKPRKSIDRLVLPQPPLLHHHAELYYFHSLDQHKICKDHSLRSNQNLYDSHFFALTPLGIFGRLGEMIRSMGLCNVDCFKEPSRRTEAC